MKSTGPAGGVGILLVVLFIVFRPTSVIPLIAGGVWAVMIAAAAVLTWRRTGLRLAAAGMGLAAVGMLLWTRIVTRPGDLFAAPWGEKVVFAAILLFCAVLMLAQRRIEPEKWRRWEEHADRTGFADTLRFRHIPDLRGDRGAVRSTLLLALAVALAFPLVSCGDSPTEAGGGGGFLIVTAQTLPMYAETGTLTVEAAACMCAKGPLLVDVNGARVGSMACAGRQDFATAKLDPSAATLAVRVTDAAGATGVLSATLSAGVSGAPSLSVRVLCP